MDQSWGSRCRIRKDPLKTGSHAWSFSHDDFRRRANFSAAGGAPQRRLERALYEAGYTVNTLSNKQGAGLGDLGYHPVGRSEARAAVQVIGVASGFLLSAHRAKTVRRTPELCGGVAILSV